MLPSDPWDSKSTGEPSGSSRETSSASPTATISIDRLAVLLSPTGRAEDLARDLKLNDIVVQACLATGATGAAIALARGDEFICRASTGSTAPDLGIKLNIDQGLSAYCVRTGEVQRCDDSESDVRVDAEVCRHLGVRSVLVVPILYGEFFLGIFEIFSPEPFAFYDRDIQTVLALSRNVLTALGIVVPAEEPEPIASEAIEPLEEEIAPAEEITQAIEVAEVPPVPEVEAEAEPEAGTAAIEEPEVPAADPVAEIPVAAAASPPAAEQPSPQFRTAPPRRDYWTPVLTVLVIGLALLLGWMIGHGRTARQNQAREQLRASVAAQQRRTPQPADAENADQAQPAESQPAPASSAPKRSPFSSQAPAVPTPAPPPADGGLVVYQEGKVIYRQGASPQSTGRLPAKKTTGSATPVELTPEMAGTLLMLRVEPHYPERARQQKTQGPVVLQASVNEEGVVDQLKVLTGNFDLAAAAIEAVRHWRFKPYAVKGKPTPFSTRVTVNFALPSAESGH